jgi:hypothetical protein
MILLLGLFIGLVSGLIAAKRTGLVSGYATLLNSSVAMYIAVYVTPVVVESVDLISQYSYGPVLCALLICVISFAILSTICSTVMGDLKIVMPKPVDTLGGGAMGFMSGMLFWGFLCLLLEVSPVSDSPMMNSICQDPQEVTTMWTASVGTSISILNTITLQDEPYPVAKAVKAMKPVKAVPPKATDTPAPETDAAKDANAAPGSAG